MMRGIVMDINKNKAVVFQNNGAVVEVSNRNYEIGQEIFINLQPYKNYMLMAACFILCFTTGISGYALYKTPSSYVYLDINPSLRLDINCFERVIDVVPLNDDASELMALYTFKSTDTQSCINDIVKACEEKQYINPDNNNIEMDVVTDKSDLKQKVNRVSETLQKNNLGVSVLDIDSQENLKAISFNTSPKRLRAVEKYTEMYGGTVEDNIADLRNVSVKDIYSQIDVQPKSDVAAAPEEKRKSTQRVEGKAEKSADAQKQDAVKDKSPSPKRSDAIEEYSKVFGGTVEENIKILKDKSVKDIRRAIEERNSSKPSEGSAVKKAPSATKKKTSPLDASDKKHPHE